MQVDLARAGGIELAGIGRDHALDVGAVLVELAAHGALAGQGPVAVAGVFLLGVALPVGDRRQLGHGFALIGIAVGGDPLRRAAHTGNFRRLDHLVGQVDRTHDEGEEKTENVGRLHGVRPFRSKPCATVRGQVLKWRKNARLNSYRIRLKFYTVRTSSEEWCPFAPPAAIQ